MCSGNIELKCGIETLENSFSEVIKIKYSDINYKECMQHDNVEQYYLIDTHTIIFLQAVPQAWSSLY